MAAGKGTRMKSDLPKVLHQLGGRELIRWVIDAAREAALRPLVLVLGHQADRVQDQLADDQKGDLRYVLQMPQNGTGHAVQMAAPELERLTGGDVIILSGDVPLIRAATLAGLRAAHRRENAAATVLTAEPPDPTGYGRILRDTDGRLAAIREQRDASEEELAIRETNTGVYCFGIAPLLAALAKLRPDNDQGEYYLTDTLAILRDAGETVAAHLCSDPVEIEGINDREQLAAMERILAERGD